MVRRHLDLVLSFSPINALLRRQGREHSYRHPACLYGWTNTALEHLYPQMGNGNAQFPLFNAHLLPHHRAPRSHKSPLLCQVWLDMRKYNHGENTAAELCERVPSTHAGREPHVLSIGRGIILESFS